MAVRSTKGPAEPGYRGPTVCKLIGITALVELRIIKRLLDAGVSLQRIREAIRYLRRAAAGKPLTDITLMSDGERIYACHSGEEVIDVLSHGQAVFGIAVGRVWADTEGELATMPADNANERPEPERRIAR